MSDGARQARRTGRGHRSRRSRDERGAVAVMIGVLLSLIVVSASFAVDIGMQRVLRSDLQALADVASLDAARLLDGRTAAQIRAGDVLHPPLAEVLATSVARNDTTLGDAPRLEGLLVRLTTDDLGSVVPVTDVDGAPVEVADGEVPDGVLVRAEGEVDFVLSLSRGAASRTAIADATTFACFRIGSFAAALSTGDSAVGGVFEAMVGDALGANLRAVGYDGLLTSSVALGDLAAELGAGTIDELATLDSLSVAELFSAYARVLGSDGRAAAQGQMGQLASQVDTDLSVDLGDLLTVGDGSAMAGSINAVDLIGSVALGVTTIVSDGNNFLKTGVAWSAPHVSQGEIALRAIAAPEQACGPMGTVATTAQVDFNADLAFALPNKLAFAGLGDLSVSRPDDLTSKSGTLHMDARLAGAQGTLVDAVCGDGTATAPDGIMVDIDTRLLTTNVSLPFRLKGSLTSKGASGILPESQLTSLVTSLLGAVSSVTSVTLNLDLRATARASSSTPPHEAVTPTEYWAPPRTYLDVQPSGTPHPVELPVPQVSVDTSGSTATATITVRTLALLSRTETVTVPLSSLNLQPVIDAATASVIGTTSSTVVGNVNQAMVPVSKLLGISTGGADLLGVAPPECGYPRLIG